MNWQDLSNANAILWLLSPTNRNDNGFQNESIDPLGRVLPGLSWHIWRNEVVKCWEISRHALKSICTE